MRTTLQKSYMQEFTWKQIRADVKNVNPELANVIDEIDPGKEYTIFKLTYPYGAEILQKGNLFLPNKNGDLIPIQEHDSYIKDKLGYNLFSNPVGMVTKGSAELFLELDDRLVQFYGIVPSGKIFGLWRILSSPPHHHPSFLWSLSSGARSVFMLPRVTDSGGYARLRKHFLIDVDKPKDALGHWEIFRRIANSSKNKDLWNMEILFFSKKWFEDMDKKKMQPFALYIYKTGWKGSEFWRNKFFLDILLSMLQKQEKLKPTIHIVNTVKYLVTMACGSVSGFAPAIDNSFAPIERIQEAFLDVYKLQDYAPIIMQPYFFDMYNPNARPVYYSLRFPTSIEFSLKSSEKTTVITELFSVKSLLSRYLYEISRNYFNLKDTVFYDIIQKAKYDFFHIDTEKYQGIKENKEIPKEDESFMNKKFKNKEFPNMNSFLMGCVKISIKK